MNVSSGPGFRFGIAPDLEGLGRDLREIAEAITAHAQCESERDKAAVYPISISAPSIHVILYVRRLRPKFLGDVPEPAFGMMLTILATRLDRGRLSLDELSAATGMSLPTTRRWVRAMVKAGFLEFHLRPQGGAKRLVDLTDQAASRIQTYIEIALQNSPWLL